MHVSNVVEKKEYAFSIYLVQNRYSLKCQADMSVLFAYILIHDLTTNDLQKSKYCLCYFVSSFLYYIIINLIQLNISFHVQFTIQKKS